MVRNPDQCGGCDGRTDFFRFIREFNEADKEMNIIYHRLARHYRLSDSVFWVLYLLGEARGP